MYEKTYKNILSQLYQLTWDAITKYHRVGISDRQMDKKDVVHSAE